MTIHTKSEAIEIFGSSAALSRALGITKSAVGQWPEELNQRQVNEVVGAAVRKNLINTNETADNT